MNDLNDWMASVEQTGDKTEEKIYGRASWLWSPFSPSLRVTAEQTRAGSLVALVTVELPPLATLHIFRINK